MGNKVRVYSPVVLGGYTGTERRGIIKLQGVILISPCIQKNLTLRSKQGGFAKTKASIYDLSDYAK